MAKRSARRAVLALVGSAIGKHALSFVRVVVLVRLLEPADFGLFGLATVLTRALETLMALGPDKYLVQRPTLDDAFVGTAWTLRAAIGAAVSILALGAAPVYAWWTEEPAIRGVVSVVAFVALLRGLRGPGVALAERDLRYGPVARFELASSIVEVTLVIGLAATVGGVYALALALVGATLGEAVLAQALFPSAARPTWSAEHAREVVGVGASFFVTSLASVVVLQGDNFVVGSLLGSTALGYYLLAYRLCDLPLQLTIQVANRVVFASLSRLGDDPAARAQAFLRSAEVQLALVFAAVSATVALATSLVGSLYGPGWEASAACLRGLVVVMFGRAVAWVLGPLFSSSGRFEELARNRVLQAVTLVVGTAVGVRVLGLAGAAPGAGVGFLLAVFLRIRVLPELGVPLGAFGALVARSALAAAPGAAAAAAIDAAPLPAVARLLVGAAAFVACWVPCAWLLVPPIAAEARRAWGRLRGAPPE